MNARIGLILPLLVTLLAGCVKEPAAFLIEGGDHSLTIERNQPYFWSSGWELDLIVARYPECQRRYPLKKSGDKLRVDLYKTTSGAFILNQNKRWYVTTTADCRMQEFTEEPPEPGEYLGNFREKDGAFAFVPLEEAEPAAKKPRKKAAK